MIFIHGANSAPPEVALLAEAFRPYADVRTPALLGHGGRPIPAHIDIRDVAADVVAWMDREQVERSIVGGYSFGGTVALYLARHYPERVTAVFALAAKHVFDARTLAHWRHLVAHERLERMRFPWGKRTDELTRMHAPNRWQDVADANARLFATLAQDPPLPAADLAAIRAPVIIVSSNLDQVVPWEETLALGKQLPDAHVAMFYGPAHPLRAIPLAAIARTVDEWLGKRGLRER